MSEPLGVTPPGLRSTAERLQAVADQMEGILSALGGQLAAEGPAWGLDDFGGNFADGEHGYLAQTEWVQGSVDAKVGLLKYYSEGLRRTANTLEKQDEG